MKAKLIKISTKHSMKALIIAGIGFLFTSNFAFADCAWQWDCSTGTCKHVPLCDSTLDMVPIEPISTAPMVTPTIEPVNMSPIPPIGTSHCDQKYICDRDGNCDWQEICG
jgi:hypothetical protein